MVNTNELLLNLVERILFKRGMVQLGIRPHTIQNGVLVDILDEFTPVYIRGRGWLHVSVQPPTAEQVRDALSADGVQCSVIFGSVWCPNTLE